MSCDQAPAILRSPPVLGVAAALVLLLISGPRIASAAAPSGGEFQVDSYTTSSQRRPSVARDAAGNFVVVWQSQGSIGNDTSSTSVQGQRYDASGSAIGDQFQVNTYTTSGQYNPRVSSDAAGNFVVVWESARGTPLYPTSKRTVQAQRYDASGAPIGGQFQVNSFAAGMYGMSHPSVASDPTGFVVVWESIGGDGSDRSVLARRFQADGSPTGQQFLVNDYTTEFQGHPSVASDSDGNFVVVWQSYGGGTDTSGLSIQGKRYQPNGAPLPAVAFQINTYTTGDQSNPSVASDPAGNFVVVWDSYGSTGSDGSTWSVHGQRYDAIFSKLGSEFQINSYTTGAQDHPSVICDAAGDFIVAWQSQVHGATDAADVQAQAYDATGAAIGAEFEVNTSTTSVQSYPALASDSGGNFVVVWQSLASAGSDTSSHSVQGQRYLPESAFVPSAAAVLAVVITVARARSRRRSACRPADASADRTRAT